jgi:hypothetical protein
MASSHAALKLFARLLPADFRERVFEPALEDLRLDELSGASRPWARAILVVECLRLGVPRYFWSRGRPTRLTIAVVSMLVVVALMLRRSYAGRDWH